MKARVAGIAGSVLALTVIGGFAAASTFQSAPAPQSVVVTPTETATVEPVAVPTTQAPVVKAPAPVESTQAPVQVAPTSEAPVAVKSPAPAPAPVEAATAPAFKQPGVGATKPPGGWSTVAGKYPDGTPLQYDVIGNVIPFVAP